VKVPGTNLLKMANRLISFQTVDYFVANGRTLNAARQWVPAFNPAVKLKASVQSVDRRSYAAMGLDFNAQYVNIFTSLDLVDLKRDSSGDRFIYNDKLYVMSKGQNWFVQDGWATCLAVMTQESPAVVNPQ
jgi:hypothetical protein